MRSTWFFAAILVAALTAPVLVQTPLAQTPPAGTPTPIRGTVEKLDDHTLTVKQHDGSSAAVALAPTFTVRTVVAKTLGDIKAGDKVGIVSVKGADGGRRALEIQIFTPAMNVRPSEIPWDLAPDSLMTNAPVVQVSSAPSSQTIKVAANGKESEIAVPPQTPIVTYGPGDAGLLKPGITVFVYARKQPDGSLKAAGVTAEKDGVKPPM